MAQEVNRKIKPAKEFSYVNEIVAIILLAVSVLVFLCLITFNSHDSSLNTQSTYQTDNLIGVFGSSIADIILQTIGVTAFILPALLAFVAWQVFRSEIIKTPFSRVFGFLLFTCSISGLLMVSGFTPFFDGLVQAGGMTGKLIEQLTTPWLGSIGAFILLFTLSIIGFLLLTNWSLHFVFSQLSTGFAYLRIGFDGLLINFNEWKNKQQENAQQRLEQRNAVREHLEKEDKKVVREESTVSVKESPVQKKIDENETAKTWKERITGFIDKLSQPPEETEENEEVENYDTNPLPKITVGQSVEKPVVETVPKIVPNVLRTEEREFVEVEKKTPIIPPKTFSENEYTVDGSIPITPIQSTDDLPAIETTQANVPPVETVKKVPQNFEKYILPPTDFLTTAPGRIEQKDEELLAIAQELTDKFKEFNATGRVMHICQGPVVTTYEYKPDAGVKFSKITSLSDDLCLALKAESIRIDRIPGKAFVGIEVPNQNRETIYLREVIESKKFKDSSSLLSVALGKTIDGLNYVSDLAKMPHLLIAGATGAGKSVGVNTLVVSILYKARPDEVKFIMVDPKRLELGVYADIPHLLTPIITDPKRAAISLKWAVSEMEKRYKELAGWGVRNIDGFNTEVKRRNASKDFDENGEPWKTLPYIVIIIDELADLMMVSGKEVEESITRLAQMARAVGIHLVLATQRPSVDVITGLIKANFPARISFRVSSKIDSRTIIDGNGAEKLLGRGDMLFLPPATSQIVRVHGAFVDEKEIHQIVEHIKQQGNPDYDTSITKTDEEIEGTDGLPGKTDPLFYEALRTVVSSKRASTSLLQRHLRIGYGRAAAILDAMVREGFIGDMDGSTRARPILEAAYDALERLENESD